MPDYGEKKILYLCFSNLDFEQIMGVKVMKVKYGTFICIYVLWPKPLSERLLIFHRVK